MHRAVWPIRLHLRPQARSASHRCRRRPRILRQFPNVVDELNSCPADIWRGEGRPGRGWDGWENDRVTLDEALALSVGGRGMSALDFNADDHPAAGADREHQGPRRHRGYRRPLRRLEEARRQLLGLVPAARRRHALLQGQAQSSRLHLLRLRRQGRRVRLRPGGRERRPARRRSSASWSMVGGAAPDPAATARPSGADGCSRRARRPRRPPGAPPRRRRIWSEAEP